jgi:hypothetical protein
VAAKNLVGGGFLLGLQAAHGETHQFRHRNALFGGLAFEPDFVAIFETKGARGGVSLLTA